MSSRKLWIIIKITVIYGLFWSFGGGSNVDEEHINLHVRASVPKNVKMGKITLEYEFQACDEFPIIVQQKHSPFRNAPKGEVNDVNSNNKEENHETSPSKFLKFPNPNNKEEKQKKSPNNKEEKQEKSPNNKEKSPDNKEAKQEKIPSYNICRDMPIVNGSGVYNISINGRYKQVYCEVNPGGTNYLVIQRRINGSVDFYRNWTEYENGFGNLNHEFWIGNQALSQITLQANYKLRIELVANDSTNAYAEFSTFYVRPAENKYQLVVSGYSGTAGDSLTYHDGSKFSTFDQDEDKYPSNCAVKFKGAWWYKSCHQSNLNGFYYGGHHDSYGDGVNWEKFKGYYESMKTTTMKIY